MATRIDPFRDLDRMASQLLSGGRGLRQMPMDLYRQGDRYVVQADLPGVDPQSVDVDVDGQLLTIRAERKSLTEDREGTQWITRERESGSYVRQLNLGQDVDLERITADYSAGVLTVTIPLSPKAQPRKIKVNAGGESETIQAQSRTAEGRTGASDASPQVDPNS